jgi:hypothetical protein
MTVFAPIVRSADTKACWEAFRDRFSAGAQVRRVRMWNDGFESKIVKALEVDRA